MLMSGTRQDDDDEELGPAPLLLVAAAAGGPGELLLGLGLLLVQLLLLEKMERPTAETRSAGYSG